MMILKRIYSIIYMLIPVYNTVAVSSLGAEAQYGNACV